MNKKQLCQELKSENSYFESDKTEGMLRGEAFDEGEESILDKLFKRKDIWVECPECGGSGIECLNTPCPKCYGERYISLSDLEDE